MYLTHVKTMLTKAAKQVFDASHPEADFRSLHVSIEYPTKEIHFPGLLVDFEPTGQLERAGIDHWEQAEPDSGGQVAVFTRWRFQGYATYTVGAMTSLERDRLLDELVRVMAFNEENETLATFRRYVENNPLIAANFDFDQIDIRGKNEAPGTPWGTDDVVYEITVAMECVGEFFSDGTREGLVPLAEVRTYFYPEGDPDPTLEPPLSNDPAPWR